LVRKMGIFGVAWGSTIPNMVVCFLFWPWYLKRTLQIPVREYIAMTWVRPLLAMAPFGLCSYLVEHGKPATHLWVFFGQIALILPFALLGFWYVCVSREERQARFEQFRRAVPVLR